jgi:DnaK suppressor protein
MTRYHLSPEQTNELAQALRERRHELETQHRRHLEGHSRAEHAREILLQDGDDAPQRDADREVDFALSDMEAIELAAIAQAQQRLAVGKYGLCSDCGGEIAYARLKLEPQAPRCIDCERLRERGTHHASM